MANPGEWPEIFPRSRMIRASPCPWDSKEQLEAGSLNWNRSLLQVMRSGRVSMARTGRLPLDGCIQSTLSACRRMPSTVPAWPRGGAVIARPRPLASPGNDRSGKVRLTAGRPSVGALYQFGGWSHTNHTPACDPLASRPSALARGEWQSPHYSSQSRNEIRRRPT